MDSVDMLARSIETAVRELAAGRGITLPEDFRVELERPKHEGHGDWASNVAMKAARAFGMPPLALAGEIAAKLGAIRDIEKIEVARPGFINFSLSVDWAGTVVRRVLAERENYGRCDLGRGRKVQVEFVSANPTGPIHLGHGRGGVVGDVMAYILDFTGWRVEREYYINDAGLQMENLGKSARSRYFAIFGREDEAPFPEDGYPGAYMDDIAREIASERGDSLLFEPPETALLYFRDRAGESILKMIRRDLSDFGVNFDVWFSEKSLYEGDLVPRAIAILREKGYAYDEDGAVWFRATKFGDDKDRVLIRQNGAPTYFTSDIAYLQNKYERGFDFLIYVWGADHHGYVPRMRSVNQALGADDDRLEFLLIQFVSLLRNGVPVAMSKRAGTYVTLREVMDEVGRDAARFSFVGRKCDSHLEFDLEMAKKTSADNPVYYVQYAHARISSILRAAAADGVTVDDVIVDDADLSLLTDPSEARLVREISRWPEEVEHASRELEPHRIAFYASDLAEAFHAWYNTQHVLGVPEPLMKARLLLAEAARLTVACALRLLGIAAPEKM